MDWEVVEQKTNLPYLHNPRYSVVKMYAYWITANFDKVYGMYACNDNLSNHESPCRGETVVTRKITVARPISDKAWKTDSSWET